MILTDVAATVALGRRIGEWIGAGDVIALSGPLGAGKTSLARGILEAVGLTGEAPSPSYAIMLAYEPPETRLPVMHVDLYRIEEPGEIEELGLGDALADHALIVEWPERWGEAPLARALWLTLEPVADGRRLTARVPEGWRTRWPPT